MKLAVIGMGYVGLPLAISISKHWETIGYDTNEERIKQLKNNSDSNNEIASNEFNKKISFTNTISDIQNCTVYIICVPTPVLKNNKPDLKYLKNALVNISKVIKKNDLIIIESTVYPGVSEDLTSKILSRRKKFKLNKDYFLGYSPERINPGDKKNTINNVTKIVSISSIKKKKLICKIYNKICKKIYFMENIMEAEAAKVIENVQRDLNIALINEIWTLFSNHTDLDTNNIIKAASTKWNFLNFKQGFVGGHCIPVDPYYLSEFAKKNKFKTELVLKGRKINNNFYKSVSTNIKSKFKNIKNYSCLILGVTYKANVADIRNSLSFIFINELSKSVKNIDFFDPFISNKKINYKFNKNINQLKEINKKKKYHLIIELVNHEYFRRNKKNVISMLKNRKNYYKL